MYEVWPGNNLFLLKGRIMPGPLYDLKEYLCVWFTPIVLATLFFITTRAHSWSINPLLLISNLNMIMITMCFLWMTTIIEGIIPKRKI